VTRTPRLLTVCAALGVGALAMAGVAQTTPFFQIAGGAHETQNFPAPIIPNGATGWDNETGVMSAFPETRVLPPGRRGRFGSSSSGAIRPSSTSSTPAVVASSGVGPPVVTVMPAIRRSPVPIISLAPSHSPAPSPQRLIARVGSMSSTLRASRLPYDDDGRDSRRPPRPLMSRPRECAR
jgi:hypothetical protein